MGMMLKRYFAVAGANGTEPVTQQIPFQYLRDCRFILNDQNETVIHPMPCGCSIPFAGFAAGRPLSRTGEISAICKRGFSDQATCSQQCLDRFLAIS